jgi:reverse gyrase
MAFKCLSCGHIFEEGEEARWYEEHGELWSGCPVCYGGYEETTKCVICNGEFLEHELRNGCVCDDCLKLYNDDFSMCYEIGKQSPQEISINGLLATLFSVDDIEEILCKILKKEEKVDCSEFIKEDEDWFAERLAEEVNK